MAGLTSTDLDISGGVDFVNSVPWCPTCLAVKVETLYEDAVVADAAYPHISFPTIVQLHAFADV